MSIFKICIGSNLNGAVTGHREVPTAEDIARLKRIAKLKQQEENVEIIESEFISESIIDELKMIHSTSFIKLITVELTNYGVIQARYKFIDTLEGEKDYGRECVYPFGNLKED